jgi:hypothetical protein
MNNSEAPFGLESFDPEPFGLELMAERLTTEGLMAERKRRAHLLTTDNNLQFLNSQLPAKSPFYRRIFWSVSGLFPASL